MTAEEKERARKRALRTARTKRWRAKHREAWNAYVRSYTKRPHIRARMKAYVEAHREEINAKRRAQARARRAANLDEHRAKARAYAARKREERRAAEPVEKPTPKAVDGFTAQVRGQYFELL